MAAKRETGFVEVGKGLLSGRRTVGKGDHSATEAQKSVSSSGRAPRSAKIIPRTQICGIRAFIAHDSKGFTVAAGLLRSRGEGKRNGSRCNRTIGGI